FGRRMKTVGCERLVDAVRIKYLGALEPQVGPMACALSRKKETWPGSVSEQNVGCKMVDLQACEGGGVQQLVMRMMMMMMMMMIQFKTPCALPVSLGKKNRE